ncbi:MAG TPA: glycosyltransferase [Anaerolineales bacterium]|nr:glycosyltransferase [Anaerolineales bacterium]
MILVTVGTHDQNFNRLTRAADELSGLTEEQVVVQGGFSDYRPLRAKHFQWASMQEMEEWIEQARIVVAQAGAGTIITVLKRHKPLVVCPRLAAFGEHYNDHQVQLATALAGQNRAIAVLELSGEALLRAVQLAEELPETAVDSSRLTNALALQLSDWQNRLGKGQS